MNSDYRNKIINIHGRSGTEWLDSIPGLIAKYEKDWGIKVGDPFNLSYNYVCPAESQNGTQLVLKLSLPGDKEFLSEYEALKRFPHEICTKIIESDIEKGSLLLERAVPGTPISQIKDDNKQIHLASQVISQLHMTVDKDMFTIFPTVRDWFKVFKRYRNKYSVKSGPIPYKVFDTGEKIFEELLGEDKEQVLLHGDLHNDNILLSERGWLVIDPKGLIGEREFELGTYLRNPYYDLPKGSDYKKLQTQRTLQFGNELGFDPARINMWSVASAVISLLWFLEDEDKYQDIYVNNFELLNNLKF
jgi:streptomycin 6-kinase